MSAGMLEERMSSALVVIVQREIPEVGKWMTCWVMVVASYRSTSMVVGVEVYQVAYYRTLAFVTATVA